MLLSGGWRIHAAVWHVCDHDTRGPVPRVPARSSPIAKRWHTSQNNVCATRRSQYETRGAGDWRWQIQDSRDVLRKIGGFEDRDITYSFEVRIVAGQEGETVLTHTSDDYRIVGEESSFLPNGLRIPDNRFIHRHE